MSVRAGIVVTGTEVLTGRVTDRNGPWLAERLLEQGVELAGTIVVGDRPGDVDGALRFFADEGCALVLTSGGLGPTADDLTAAAVAAFQARPPALDPDLEERIAAIVRPLMSRWPGLDPEAMHAATRKQAMVPHGATVLEPVGTAPGLVVPPPHGTGGPTVVVLPGPPSELQPMWRAATQTSDFAAAIEGAVDYRQGELRLFGIPESEIAETLRVAERAGIGPPQLEITTCLRGGEVEVVTRYEARHAVDYEAFADVVRSRHADTLYSEDGRSVDDQVAALLLGAGETIAVAESCTGGMLAARLTAAPGSSAHMVGGLVVYADAAKVEIAGVDPELIAHHGAVSVEVAEALAEGAIARVGADVGVGVTGIAGPGGGSEEKPVGTVCFSVAHRDGRRLTRRVHLPGRRADVRQRSTTVALHLVRRLLSA